VFLERKTILKSICFPLGFLSFKKLSLNPINLKMEKQKNKNKRQSLQQISANTSSDGLSFPLPLSLYFL
jgi:hypothetical protein